MAAGVGRVADDLAAVEAARPAYQPLPETVSPPICPCHGEPMKARPDRPGQWRCAVKQRAYDVAYRARSTTRKDRYHRLKAKGICVRCGQEPAITATSCFACAAKLLDAALLTRT